MIKICLIRRIFSCIEQLGGLHPSKYGDVFTRYYDMDIEDIEEVDREYQLSVARYKEFEKSINNSKIYNHGN